MNSSHHAEPHKNYIRGIDEATCRFMSELSEDKDICDYVTLTDSCHEAQDMINYLNFVFCVLISYVDKNFFVAALFLTGVAFVYIVALGVTTFYIVPNVVTVVKYCHLSEHSGGLIILILFNGLPDIMSAFLLYEGDTELVANELMGTALCLRAFQSALLISVYPLILHGQYFLRDSLLYLLGLLMLFMIFAERESSVYEGILAMSLYPILLITVYVNHVAARNFRERVASPERMEVTKEMKTFLELTKEIVLVEVPLTSSANPLDMNIWKQFLIVVNPFRSERYDYGSRCEKILIKMGVFFAIPIKLVVPIVNLLIPGHGYSRLLLVFNMILSPLLLLPRVGISNLQPCLIAGCVMAFLLFITTKTSTPRYQFFLAIYGAVAGIYITNIISAELNAVLIILGNIFGLKRSVIGTLFLGWTNSVSEFIISWMLVGWNFKTLAFVSLLMAPLFNLTFSIGLTSLLKSISTGNIWVVLRAGDTGRSDIWFSFLHHVLFSFAVITANYQFRRSIGLYSIMIYVIVVLYTCLYQFDVIHAFGSDHVNEKIFISASWA